MSSAASPVTSPWIHRGLSLFCLGSLIPASFMAGDQISHLAGWWLLVFGAGILLTTAAMAVTSLSGYPVGVWAWAYVVLALIGLATWPLAWEGGAATDSPWIWMCLGVASVWIALIAGTKWGFLYAIGSGLAFALVRLTPSGGEISVLAATQDMLLLVVNPSAVIIGISVLTDAIRDLDSSLADWQQEQAKAAVEEALVEERRRLDGIVHDEVMTALVGATQPGENSERAAALAAAALARLEGAGEPPADSPPVDAQHLAWLVEDVVSSACPEAQVSIALGHGSLSIPASVASAFGQASREVALNITRHARASKVDVTIGDPPGRRRGFRVVLRDNGVGFNPDQVGADRFGLRHSVHESLQAAGASVEVRSRPGQGTQVALAWFAQTGEPSPGPVRGYPQIPTISSGTLAGLIGLLIGLHFVLGWTSLDVVTATLPVFLAQALAVVATFLALRQLSVNPIPVPAAVAVVLLSWGTTVLVQSVLPFGIWPGYATWHSSVVMVLMVVLLFRGRLGLAWIGLGGFAAASLVWAFSHGLGFGEVVRVAFGPVSWMVVAHLVSRWLSELEIRQRATRKSSRAANHAIAQSYSRLVLRDVWLRQLRAQVGPLLTTIADPGGQLSVEQIRAAGALERRLRDGLRASNLVADGTQEIIEAAREAGTEVTLVDSRGSALPLAVRESVREILGDILTSRGVRRVVVRAAPEGYAATVTILIARTDQSTELIGLDSDGARTSG